MADFLAVTSIKNRMCDYYSEKYKYDKCYYCPLGGKNNQLSDTCNDLLTVDPGEFERVCLEWNKDHPLQRNINKFEEVFGIAPNIRNCVLKNCDRCKITNRTLCPKWWYEEYKAPTEG